MSTQITKRKRSGWRTLMWIVLGIAGLLVGFQLLGWMLGTLLWPLLVMAPGLFLFATVRRKGRKAAWLTIPATPITMLGLLLLAEGLFSPGLDWWGYSWTLLFPTSVGLGLSFYGDLARKSGVASVGDVLAKGGIVLFLLGLFFFSLFPILSGALPMLVVLAITMIVLAGGAYLFLSGDKNRERQPLPADRRPAGALEDGPLDDPLSDLGDPQEQARVR